MIVQHRLHLRVPPLDGFHPSWFAAVMGTGILAVSLEQVSHHAGLLSTTALALWLTAIVMFAVLSVGFVWQLASRRRLDIDVRHPRRVFPLGCIPMAIMTIGAGALQIVLPRFGWAWLPQAGIALWVTGTVLGLATTIGVLMALLASPAMRTAEPTAAWLLPFVPPMVAAANAVAVLPQIDPTWQRGVIMLGGCLFFITGLSTLILLPLIVGRIVTSTQPMAPQDIPGLWLVMGIVGQSMTASVGLTAAAKADATAGSLVSLAMAGQIFATGVLAFGLVWLLACLGLTIVRRVATSGFGAFWWGVIFPVGTLCTGTMTLGQQLHRPVIDAISVALVTVLAALWLVVASRAVMSLFVRARPALPHAHSPITESQR